MLGTNDLRNRWRRPEEEVTVVQWIAGLKQLAVRGHTHGITVIGAMVDGEPVFVGMDFNVGKMAAVIHVKRSGQPRAVGEVVNAYDTPDMIRRIKERYERPLMEVFE